MIKCKDCNRAEVTKEPGKEPIWHCEASLNELGFSEYKDVSDDCPLKTLDKTYVKGDSRAQKYIADHPLESVGFVQDRFYPVRINFLDQVKLRCTKDEGYIKECDREPSSVH